MIDDASSRLQYARFVEQDNGQVNREVVIAYLERHGRPLAFYADPSPQGKGRVERDFGTAQDRLIKEMRVEGIATIEAANQFRFRRGGDR